MRPSLALLLLLVPLTAAPRAQAPAQNTLTDAERNDGWTLLFDGATTQGWRGYRQAACPDGWKAVDGALTRVAQAGDIVSDKEYGSFDFHFDWRLAKNGNSGVFFHVVEDPALKEVYESGPEYQLLDNMGHPDGKNGPDRWTGANYALHAPTKNTAHPIGEWNESRILVRGDHVEHWLNGVKVVEYELGSPDWKARVAKSKFAAMPKYATAKTGRLALQDHGFEVAFRNMKIKGLD